MKASWARALAFAALIGWSTATLAAGTIPTAQAGLEQVQAQKRMGYEAVLAQFDRAIAAAPDDASIGVARCEFINQFTDEEFEWIEGADEHYAACAKWLGTRWPGAPAVQLFELEQHWDEGALGNNDTLEKSIATWPAPLRMRAFAHLARAYEDIDMHQAGAYAVRAAELGNVGSVTQAIKHLVARKQYREATRLLDTAPVPESPWMAGFIVQAALALPDRQAAWRTVQRFERGGIEDLPVAIAAAAQMRAGDVAGARKRLGNEAVAVEDHRELAFDIAIAARDADAALSYIDVTDIEAINANLGRFAVLASAMPSSLFSAPMLSMLFLLFAMLAGVALVSGLVLVSVHYRGLARRLRHLQAPPLFPHASLPRAWYGLAITLTVPMLGVFVFAPQAVEALLDGEKTSGMYAGLLWGTVAGLLCLIPVSLGMSRRELIGDATVWRAWKRVLLAWFALTCVSTGLGLYHQWTGGGDDTLQTQMVETLVGEGNAALGGLGSLLLVALLGPVFEEAVFRWLLLGGLARHLSFRWANGLQALAFAVAHGDPPRFVFYLAMGLLCGWLVKSTRSLGPAIALHALNNALFVALSMV